MAQSTGLKRKVHYDASSSSPRAQKRQKSKDAREISSQTPDMALSASGELNIASFIKAREFEINALDKSMRKARQGLMSRAFQQVPRHMRRRTASHNVKKVPRRLRKRAIREMKEDNTPTVNSKTRKPSHKLRLRLETAKALKNLNSKRKTVRQTEKDAKRNGLGSDLEKYTSITRMPRLKKNKLAEPPRATSKFKRRQINKTWLPTHLWHTKRAHMTRPKEPLWHMAVPLKPTEKSYRPTHRAAGSRGCVAWDMSYVSTVECFGTELALESMLKLLRFSGESWSGQKYKRWKSGSRFIESWVYEQSKDKKPIAPVTIVWEHQNNYATNTLELDHDANHDIKVQSSAKRANSARKRLDRRIMIRIHPSAFHHFWLELLKAAKIQKPQVLVEDLRFEIGSILIEGPGSTEALVGVLKPKDPAAITTQVWTSLAGLFNPATLPMNALLAFDVADPRLAHPPKQVKLRKDDASQIELNELIISWPIDKEQPSERLFSHKARYASGRSMLSQKAIKRRKAANLPGQPLTATEKDTCIPIMLLAHRCSGDQSNMQGSWEILMPWGGVDAVWRSLMYYPLSSGSTPRFGGLKEVQQISFEQSTPWFPGDFPGTEAGKAWDRTESEKRFDQWVRRPPSRRYAWDALDLGIGRKGELGRGWACDWEYLFTDSIPKPDDIDSSRRGPHSKSRTSTRSHLLTQRQRKAEIARSKNDDAQRRRNTSSPESESEDEDFKPPDFFQLTPAVTMTLFHNVQSAELPKTASLTTVRITLLTRGTPCPAARIYRLPTRLTPSSKSPSASEQRSQQYKIATAEAALSASQPSDVGTTSLSLFSTTPASRNKPTPFELRQRWLSLDPNSTASTSNPHSSTSLPQSQHQRKLRPNHHNDPRVGGRFYPSESLEHIRVFPEDAPKEVKEMYGPAPARKTREQALKDLMPIPNTINGFPDDDDDEDGAQSIWERRHVPCPDPHDLIGFVTSGGYNLAQGKGTAIGAVWVQRVVEGWRKDNEQVALNKETLQEQGDRKQKEKLTRQRDRERHLCIVRNAGESVGRLGIWELC